MKKQKLPLLVLYETKESWYVEDSKPVAIFLKPDEIAVYAYNLPKMPYCEAKRVCNEMEVENLFWEIPNTAQLQELLNLKEAFAETARLIGADSLENSKYWGRGKTNNSNRLGLNFAWDKEVELAEYEYAFVRPFLRV